MTLSYLYNQTAVPNGVLQISSNTVLLTGLDHQKLAPVSTQGLKPSYWWVSFLSATPPFLDFSHCASSIASPNRTGIHSAFPELCNPLFLSSGIFTLCPSRPSPCVKLTSLDPSSSGFCVSFSGQTSWPVSGFGSRLYSFTTSLYWLWGTYILLACSFFCNY